MHFREAAAAVLRSGAKIEATGLYNKYGRFYKVHEPGAELPPVWMSVSAVIKLAELEESLDGE